MAFKAVVHFSGAGIGHIVRDLEGNIREAYCLYPDARLSHPRHTPRLCVAGPNLDDLALLGQIQHQLVPGADGAAYMLIDLVDATLIARGGPRRVRIYSDLSPGLSEDKSEDGALKKLWDATQALDPLEDVANSDEYAVVVTIQDGKLGSEDPVPGKWKLGEEDMANPNDRMRVEIECDRQLVLEMDPLTLGLSPAPDAPAGTLVELSFSHLPDRLIPLEPIHYHVLARASLRSHRLQVWPKLEGVGATFPFRPCPYGLVEKQQGDCAAGGDGHGDHGH
jgi:hypothetical protein